MEKSLICLALTERTIAEACAVVDKYRKHIDCVELRADFLDPSELASCVRFPARAGLPTIITIRKPADGGRFAGTEAERAGLLEKALDGGFAFIDLEGDFSSASVEKKAALERTTVIRSLHDFNGVPSGLLRTLASLPRNAGEIPKAAVMPKSTDELFTLVTVMKESRERKKILLGMGRFGFPTRILAGAHGSFLTYCSVPGKLAAPGHIDPVALDTLYGYRSIGPSTMVFGIIGFPLEHSRSPIIHNRGFRELGLDAVYLQFPTDDAARFFDIANAIDMCGFSVTVPHKETVMSRLRSFDDQVRAAGACNTVIRGKDGYVGHNTDIDGFITPLKKAFNGNFPKELRATVIGAGGAGKACAFALMREKMEVLILNRTAARARELAERLGCGWGSLDADGLRKARNFADVIVQTTSAGMEPNESEDPFAEYDFTGNEIAYDIVYKPPVTRFLSHAKAAGCKLISGIEMLREQAYTQFRLFTGRDYPESLRFDPDLV